MRGAFIGGAFAACVWLACGSSYDETQNPVVPPKDGERFGKCYANSTCNAGLSCIDGLCVVTEAGAETSSDGGNGGTNDLALERLAAAGCQRLLRCTPDFYAGSFGDAAECVANALAVFEARMPGVAVYTAEAADQCAAKLADSDCALFLTDITECRLSGTLEDGKPCNGWAQCSSGACFKAAGAETCGVCGPAKNAGDDCKGTDDCARGLYCNAGERCALRGKDGDPCMTAEASPCGAGLVCQSGVCKRPLSKGDDCSTAKNACYPGLFCNGEAKCGENTYAGIGESCVSALCAGTSSCIGAGSEKRCVAHGKVGDACGSGLASCGSGLRCSANARCEKGVAAGTCL